MKPGKIYICTKTKIIVLCTDENLETFSGVVIKTAKSKKALKHLLDAPEIMRLKKGDWYDEFNADYKYWKVIKPQDITFKSK